MFDSRPMTKVETGSGRRVAILQSCYIPWKGYFDIVGSVDVFVIYDDVQFSKNHWHNRNRIKTQAGSKWITVPVSKGPSGFQRIEEVQISQPFAVKHWRSIQQSYSKAAYFDECSDWLEDLYREAANLKFLSDINILFMKAISTQLKLGTTFVSSSSFAKGVTPTGRLVDICCELGCSHYLSGPSARDYLDQPAFAEAGIEIEWMDYSYSEYPQIHGAFDHYVSIVDLFFNVGFSAASEYMKISRVRA